MFGLRHGYVGVGLVLAGLVLLSSCIEYLYDAPLRSAIKRLFARRTARRE